MFIKKLYITILFLTAIASLRAQEPTVLNEQFSGLKENISFITDKNLYLAGEQIWFQGNYSHNSQVPENELSKVLYVELFSSKKDIIWQGKFKIEKDASSGKIDIPAEISSNIYFIRVYTQFQKNFPPESFFTKAISIINPSVPLPALNQLIDEKIIITPQGGKLINSVENSVAVRMQSELASRLISASVTDQNGNIAAEPVMYNNGLGYFQLNPVDSLNYNFWLIFRDGDTIVEKLPKSVNSGYLLTTKFDDNNLKINILNQKIQTEVLKSTFNIVIHSENKQVILDTILSQSDLTIAKSKFESKIYECQLVSENKKILARNYFFGPVENPELLAVQTDKKTYNSREKVELTVETNTDKQNLAISISVSERGTNNIFSNLLPTYLIENPILLPFYLQTAGTLDTAMINQIEIIMQLASFQDKKLFPEKEVLNSWSPETSDVTIAAILREKITKKPIINRIVYVSVLGNNPQLHVNKTNKEGKVFFSLNHATQSRDVFLCTDNQPDEELELLVLNDFSNEIPTLVDVFLEIDTTYKNQLEKSWKTLQVENQYKVLAKLKTEEELPLPSRFGEPDYLVETKNYIELSSLEELFKELVPYTRLKKRGGEYYFEVMDPRKNIVYEDPLVLFDNVPVFNYDGLSNIPFSQIETVEVFNKQYVYGDFVFNGIILINTKTDNFAGLMMPYNSVFAVYQTITPEVTIQFPEYTSEDNKHSRLPDFRTLLFWEPDVRLQEKKTSFNFYTSDYEADYDVIIYGKTPDGKRFFGKTSFQVTGKKPK